MSIGQPESARHTLPTPGQWLPAWSSRLAGSPRNYRPASSPQPAAPKAGDGLSVLSPP